MKSIGLVLTGALLLTPRPGQACSCIPATLEYPTEGAVDVPRDVVLLAGPPREAFRLVQGDAEVGIAASRVDTWVYEIRPAQPLAPHTTYELLDLSEHVVTFTTGDGLAPPPVEPGVTEFRVRGASFEGRNSCVAGQTAAFIDLAVEPDDGAVFYSLRQPRDGRNRTVRPDELVISSDTYVDVCGLGYVLEIAGETLCFELAAQNAAGERSAYVEHCAPVEPCEPTDVIDPVCQPPAPPPAEAEASSGCHAARGGPGGPMALVVLLAATRRRRAANRKV